ncbi:hypothetical protein DFP72DRAFT_341893, partial [Ephemerocybe angulata]
GTRWALVANLNPHPGIFARNSGAQSQREGCAGVVTHTFNRTFKKSQTLNKRLTGSTCSLLLLLRRQERLLFDFANGSERGPRWFELRPRCPQSYMGYLLYPLPSPCPRRPQTTQAPTKYRSRRRKQRTLGSPSRSSETASPAKIFSKSPIPAPATVSARTSPSRVSAATAHRSSSRSACSVWWMLGQRRLGFHSKSIRI